ncbi:flavodoxin [Lactobacillus corticis]|uniref:Flavodoxin n=1 Tax=Lactobacillus corticis TaxID=2201249 RepID=A0A916QIQ6_9LACO|nr:flavodoxin [Lactobacillus corticis]GFZ27774.1 flavodoxin [Lactobacillus corticis]
MKYWKKIVTFLGLGLLLVLFTSACSRTTGSKSASKPNTPAKVSKGNKNSKTLILYFSLSGTTKGAAEYIHKQTGADMIRLHPKTPYKGYDNAASRGDRERRRNIHPALATKIPNFSKYTTVLIGYPTWWQRPPMLIHTLFDDYNFKGKTVIPFTTSMSTPISASEKVIKQLAQEDGAKFKNGIRYDDNDSQVKKWLQNLGLTE